MSPRSDAQSLHVVQIPAATEVTIPCDSYHAILLYSADTARPFPRRIESVVVVLVTAVIIGSLCVAIGWMSGLVLGTVAFPLP
jgi:hypothetical protein